MRYMRLIGDGDSSVMANISTTVPYGPFVQKIECANHACKCYRSRLEALAKDHPEFRGKGGLTKRVIQRLTVGARVAIRMHNKTGNVQQLRHDLRNAPNHVFGDHRKCNPAFCTSSSLQVTNDGSESDDSDSDDDADDSSNADHNTLPEQIDDIISDELDATPTTSDEHDAQKGTTAQLLKSIHPGLFAKIQSCADRLVMLSAQLIDNETSNLAECYMSIRSNYDGGKYFNRIQSGSFEAKCYAAGLRCQDGPSWILSVANHFIGSSSSQVLETAISKKVRALEKDQERKEKDEYKQLRRRSKYAQKTSTDADYGPDSQQPDITTTELHLLCEECYQRHISVTLTEATEMEQMTRKQAESQLWYQQRRLRLTASSFGKVAKRRDTTPVANLVKNLLYRKAMDVASLRWGKTHEEDARQAYIAHMALQGQTVSVQECGLVIDVENPCLACSPDGRVTSDCDRGLLEIKCPYTAAKEGLTPLQAATDIKGFCCKLSTIKQGTTELKRSHDYHYQIQGQLAITKLSWCDFFVWTPAGHTVERIRADSIFWENIQRKLIRFHREAILPELVLPRYTHGQLVREPFL